MGKKWQLPRTSKKIHCPSCGHRTFKPYVYTDTGDPVDETRFGRCDRANNCTYDEKPDKVESGHKEGPKVLLNEIIYPKEDILMALKRAPTNLHLALADKGIPVDFLYDNGILSDNELTVYVFRDINGRLCNTKHFKYKRDGHRTAITKDYDSFSLKQPKQRNPHIREFYTMPLFGEEDLATDPEKKKIVCIVESEKSRVIAKFHYPEFIWLACGSANGLSDGTDGTADKITPLKGRTVYWVCDNDPAARGKFRTDENGKDLWVDCSSIRNGKKHLAEDFHICDLFTDQVQGYDIGDALLDGLKPEIKPTWSSYKTNPFYQCYVPASDYRIQEQLASQVGESSCITDEFDNTFSWMRTHINAFYGWANDGKGTMLDFFKVIKAKKSGWKFCFWKEEDMGAYHNDGAPIISADRIYAKLAWTLMGKVPPPYKLYADKHKAPMMTTDEYYEAMKWVRKHFFAVDPKDTKYKSVRDLFMFMYETFGIDVFEIDPWSSLTLEEISRGDERMIQPFKLFKRLSMETNTVTNLVNHAGSKHEVKEKGGAFKVVNQFMQLGGAAWDMKMDGQFSIHRPYRHKHPNDPRVHFWNLKQRDSEAVGSERGVYKYIEFDRDKRQYFFRGVCPIDGSRKEPMKKETEQATQGEITYTPSWRKKEKKDKVPFGDHLVRDWGQSPTLESDEVPFQ